MEEACADSGGELAGEFSLSLLLDERRGLIKEQMALVIPFAVNARNGKL